MPGDYSRNTFDPRRHYSGVLMQQGRVQLDADWNEQLAIAAHRAQATAADVIGATGTPKGDGFKIGKTADNRNLSIATGRYYLDGLLCEQDTAGLLYTTQPDHPAAAPLVLAASRTYLAYLTAWEDEVTHLSDPHIREVALGGPDTALRRRVVWQVRLAPLAASPADCTAPIPEWAGLSAPSSGTLKARSSPPAPATSPCLLAPGAGYTRLENQLYRVEIQAGGGPGTATFKWSRDNASVETRIEAGSVGGTEIIVADLGKDAELGFAPGQWVEIVSHASEVERSPAPLLQITDINPALNKITLSGSTAAWTGHSGLRLRRWDQGAAAIATGSGWIDLENGVQVSFPAGSYRVGDYWLIPARSTTGDVEWPPFIPGAAPDAVPPLGPRLHHARLALVSTDGSGLITTLRDCRAQFPPLTAIAASDVSYTPDAACGLGFANVHTVKEALDAFCRLPGCTLVLSPGQNLQAIIDGLPAGADVSICLKPGTYTLAAPLVVSGKGRVKLSGAGRGTRLVAAGAESALRFASCPAVSVRDIEAESGSLAVSNRINGTLDFEDCTHVEVSDSRAICAGGPRRAAACISVRHTVRPSKAKLHQPTLRVSGCDLEAGHRQVGLLVVDCVRTTVLDNRIHAAPRAGKALGFAELVKDRHYRDRVAAGLIANATLGDVRPPAGGVTNTTVKAGNRAVQFRTHPDLKKSWSEHLAAHPPAAATTGQALLAAMHKAVDLMIATPSARSGGFSTWFDAVIRENAAVLFQGIVVGGQVAEEVRVRDNTVEDALQGIHIGVSHKVRPGDTAASRTDVAGTVQVSGNRIEITLAQETSGDERHGIFVGNCTSLVVEANRIKLQRLSNAPKVAIDGIRVFGHIGRMAAIQRNYLEDFTTGILFQPRFPYPAQNSVMWTIAENLALGASTNHSVVVPARAPVELRLNRP